LATSVVRESLSPRAAYGVVIICVANAIGSALMNAVVIAAYTLVDGGSVRRCRSNRPVVIASGWLGPGARHPVWQ
jgi:hypothetical protein